MAKDITLMGASYQDVPSVELPQTGGGTASFHDTSDSDATDADVLDGVTYYGAMGKGTGRAVIPTKTSELTNDSGFLTLGEVPIYYGTCTTGRTTKAKVGTVDESFKLVDGVMVLLRMSNTNGASAPTLNVNGTGAKPILRYVGSSAQSNERQSWYANGCISTFVYSEADDAWFIPNAANLYYSNASASASGLMTAAQFIQLRDLSASTINVTDTHGICGTSGATVTIQALMDAIAARV